MVGFVGCPRVNLDHRYHSPDQVPEHMPDRVSQDTMSQTTPHRMSDSGPIRKSWRESFPRFIVGLRTSSVVF